jgi:hypothetical protein
MTFSDILDAAMYSGEKLIITTKERGQIIGIPHSVDDFQTDDMRFGYFIDIDEHTQDTVYVDEIASITVGELIIVNRTERFTA